MTVEPDGKYLVTGCGHSGTGWTARVLTHLGLRCGHEAIYNHTTVKEPTEDTWGVWWGDSAWPALPWIRAMPAGRPILHVVRNPIDVLASVHSSNFLAATCDCGHNPGAHLMTPYARFIFNHAPLVHDADTDLDRAIMWISRWNFWIEEHCAGRNYRRVRVEDLTADPVLLADVAQWLTGEPVTEVEARAATALVATTHNTHRRYSMTWDDVPSVVSRPALVALAERYGYPVENP